MGCPDVNEIGKARGSFCETRLSRIHGDWVRFFVLYILFLVRARRSLSPPGGDGSRDGREGEGLKAPSVQPPSTREIPSSKLQIGLPETAFNPATFFRENSVLNIQQPRFLPQIIRLQQGRFTRLIRIRHSSNLRHL
jgi:hypothetical protein